MGILFCCVGAIFLEAPVKLCVYYLVYSVSFCNVCWKGFTLSPPDGIRLRLKIYDFIPWGRHLLFLPWRKKVSKKGQDCARLTRKTYVQKAEIVQTHSGAMRRSSNSGRFLTAFRTGFSALRSRSVSRVFYLHLTDYELGVILSASTLTYYLSKTPNLKTSSKYY